MEPAETLEAPPHCKEVSIRRVATKCRFFSLQKSSKNLVFQEKSTSSHLAVRTPLFIKLLLLNFTFKKFDRGYLLLEKCSCMHQICLFLLNYCHTYWGWAHHYFYNHFRITRPLDHGSACRRRVMLPTVVRLLTARLFTDSAA